MKRKSVPDGALFLRGGPSANALGAIDGRARAPRPTDLREMRWAVIDGGAWAPFVPHARKRVHPACRAKRKYDWNFLIPYAILY